MFLAPLFFFLALIITIIKRKKQLGKVWSGPVSATLTIAGKQLNCSHCGHEKFQKREGLLVTSLVSLFAFSFWNQSGTCYTCSNCQHVEWFVRPQEKVN